jgi:hypothetical protein
MSGLRLVRLYFLLGVQGVKRAFGIEPAIPLLTRKQLNERYIKPAVDAMVKEQEFQLYLENAHQVQQFKELQKQGNRIAAAQSSLSL